ncbi:MAG: SDR family NAD(P)-dependent oxidoreductase [Acetobacteraceae bacterium]|nr:SDR family NAD(P)-dependent oxidoreductase [Acetobacteraceae bacterium]
MQNLKGKIAWVTGAGSGIGEGAAVALAEAGATVVLTGRRVPKLEAVAARIGQHAHVQPGDMTVVADVNRVAAWIREKFGRLDIFVANAGANIPKRSWADMEPSGADMVIAANLNSAFYGVLAVLPMMRAQKDGVIIVTASMAGRFIGGLSGAAYTASKHGAVAMSHSINMQECVNGIRCTALLPGEVATEILDKRPVPVSAEDRAKMVQSPEVGDLIRYIACLPPHVTINEVMITPTWNRGYVNALRAPKL